MTFGSRAPILRAVVAASVALTLGWVIGGQAALGRIDPALVLPLLTVPALLLGWTQRREAAGVRRRTSLLLIALLLLAQAALAYALGGHVPWLQLALVAVSGGAAALIADLLCRRRAGRAMRVALALLIVAGWFVGGHVLLAALYRPGVAAGPPVTIVTSLPLRWSGGSDIAAMIADGTNDDPALAYLEAAGPVRLVDSIVDNPPLPGGALLLAHPPALAPRELVAIDAFVRGGGRAIILADALSSWPARHPLGDARNPPLTSLLTPMLDHWGVTLGAAPEGGGQGAAIDLDSARLRLFSAGRFDVLPPICQPLADRRLARCRIGQGTVWLIGDADLLFAPLWQPATPWAAHLRAADTMEWLAARLWSDAPRAAFQPLWIHP